MKKNKNKKYIIAIVIVIIGVLIIGLIIKNTQEENTPNGCRHNYILEKEEATCLQEGYEKYVCTKCSNSYGNIVLEKKEHNYIETIIPSTCEIKGYTQYECEICKYIYYDKFSELGKHNFVNGICSYCSEYDGEKFLTYELDSETNTYKIVSAYKGIKKITIPNLYNGIPVSSIERKVFSGNINLERIVIPENVTSIGTEAFYGCTNLKEVIFDGQSNLTSIGNWSFAYCERLINIKIPNSVQKIESQAFVSCEMLTSVEIPSGVKVLEYRTFGGCSRLTYVKLNEGLERIDDVVFGSCSLKEIKLPNTLKEIGRQAFNYNTELKEIILPKNLQKIDDEAFLYCSSLEYIFYEGTDYIGSFIIKSQTYTSYAEYATVYYYTEDFPTDNKNYWYYDENNKPVIW